MQPSETSLGQLLPCYSLLLRLAVNRLAEKGVWDIGELEAEFKELYR
jgi:hypothetical protein